MAPRNRTAAGASLWRTGPPSVWAATADIVDPPELALQRDPVSWASARGVFLWSLQRRIIEAVRDHAEVAVHSCHEVGKALSLDTEIPTPAGWVLMGDLKVGDRVYDERGQVCYVTNVTPTWNVDTYRVTLGDGTEIVTSGDHEWQVWHTAARHRAGGVDRRKRWDLTVRRTTVQLASNLRGSGRHEQIRWFIPVARAVQGDDSVELPIPPYLLGLWLGDGSKTTGSLVLHVDDVDEVMSHVDWPHRLRQVGNVVDVSLYGLIGELRQLGLYDNKHIPEVYLRAGVEARRELLRGLMDSDGHCVRGRCDNGQKSLRLADDLYELVTGLGIQARRSTKNVFLYGKPCGQSHVVGFTCDFEPFKLKRKLARWRPQSSGSTLRSIVNIDRVETVPTRCITVDSPSHLYLATRSYVPTHNSFIAALAACWWIDTHPPGTAFVVTTAPTGPQVEAILWREINRMHARAGLRGRTNLTEWYIGRELVAYGRKPSEYNPAAFQGTHARYFLVILDEACGIPKTLWDTASTLAANEHGRVLAIGNPDDAHGEFAENCRPSSGWHVIHIGYEMTPNFTGERVPRELAELLIHPHWVEGRRRKWGETSALFTSKCRGLFPTDADAGTIPYSWLTACRYLEHPDGLPVEAGVDVGGGGDRTIIRERRGTRVGRERVFVDPDPMRTVGRLSECLRDWGIQRVKVDSTGIGWGIYGRLRELSSTQNPTSAETTHAAEVVPVNFAESPSDPRHFLNRRAELWWLGRELSRLRGWDLGTTDVVDDDTVAELVEPHYEIIDSSGKVKIEKKDEVIKRLGRSPDSAEALLLAFLDKRWEVTPPRGNLLTETVLTRGLDVF